MAMLPLGALFDTIRIPADVLYAALVNVRPAGVGQTLANLLGGPVIQDDERWFYPLVRVGGAVRWHSPAARYLSQGWLAVPRADQLAPPGAYWVVPPREPGRLCDLGRVGEMVSVGVSRLAGASS
ncbi:hypothetical protein ACFYVL_40345 [Streptomyces sp. NPDC004111]|uniref:hypothetical protein n=1 Tax=Streptomyces sp. NPDC004111 TaxID=3364690 RepID=UPI0036815B47